MILPDSVSAGEVMTMATVSMMCPSCGAPVQMPPGRSMCYCQYCGSQVKIEMSDAEITHMEKNNEFVEAVKAAIHCLAIMDYKNAIEYAEKASAIHHDDPGPVMVKYLATLDLDYKKAVTLYSLSQILRDSRESEALGDEEYKDVLETFASNYLVEKEKDFKRMFMSMKKVKPADIHNVWVYDRTRKLDTYFKDKELQEAFMHTMSDRISECESEFSVSNDVSQSNWDAIVGFREKYFFKLAGALFVDPSLRQRYSVLLTRYSNALNLKWEAAFKRDQVIGTKDEVRLFRDESDSILAWIKSMR